MASNFYVKGGLLWNTDGGGDIGASGSARPNNIYALASVNAPSLVASTSLTIAALSGVLKASSGLVSGSATTSDLPEGSNLYFSNARVLASVLTGYVSGPGTISSADSVLSAIEKLNGNIAAISSDAIDSLTGDVTATGPGAAAATVAAIQGNTVSGTTGTTNVVFSASPTLTGIAALAGATFTGNIVNTTISGYTSPFSLSGLYTTGGSYLLAAYASSVANTAPVVLFGRSGGSSASPTAVQTGYSLGGIAIAGGYGAGSPKYMSLGTSFCPWNMVAAQNWATNAWGYNQVFGISGNSQASGSTILTLSQSGNIVLGPSSPNANYNFSLVWGADGLQDIGSSDGGTTMLRPNNVYIKNAINLASLTASAALVSDASKNIISSITTATELSYVHGVTSAIQTQLNALQPAGNYITALTGDVTASGPGSAAATLATVNSNVGSFGSASSVASFTVNAKGLITAASNVSIQISESQVTGLAASLALYLPLAGGTMSGAIDMGANQINDMANPTLAQDAATKFYVDNAINGLTWKGPVQAYANSNVPLTGGATLTIDGYSVQNGDYVILANQTIASQNYVYVASGIGTAYTLTQVVGYEAPTAIGDAYLIEQGTQYGGSAFQVNAISPNVTFIQFAGPNEYSFNAPLSLSGTTVSLNYADTNSIDLSLSTGSLVANLNLSAASPDAGYVIVHSSIKSDGLFAEVAISDIYAQFSAVAPLSYNSSTGAFSISQATTSTDGYLSSTDWNTFNNKQAAGNYITALTGDVSASGPGSAAATVNYVGGAAAADIATATAAYLAATSSPETASTLVIRNSSNQFAIAQLLDDSGHWSVDVADHYLFDNSGAGGPPQNAIISVDYNARQLKDASGNYNVLDWNAQVLSDALGDGVDGPGSGQQLIAWGQSHYLNPNYGYVQVAGQFYYGNNGIGGIQDGSNAYAYLDSSGYAGSLVTTDATPLIIYQVGVGNGGPNMINTGFLITANIVGYRQDAPGVVTIVKTVGAVTDGSGNFTILTPPGSDSEIFQAGNGTWDASWIVTGSSPTDLAVQVTGQAGATISWFCTINVTKSK